jgi:tRNA modification GTPase
MTCRDTIAAIATAPGRAAIGIVRVSGAGSARIAREISGREVGQRAATLAPFLDAQGRAMDRGIALFFCGPHSYTGEDVLELQGHGGPVVLQMLLRRCIELGARVAEPGEFTQRAFLNGKLDLVQAEGVIDLIDASTAQAARGAMRSLQGEFSRRIQSLSASLVELRALVESSLDFPEDDIDVLDRTAARDRLASIRAELDQLLDAAKQGSVLREGIHVAIAGEPNVGKSSLLNRLAGEDVAIVTDVPGTTRDLVRHTLDVGGIPIHIVDTAGLRETDDVVERIGVERARRAIAGVDVLLLLTDARSADGRDALAAVVTAGTPRIHVMNKIDLADIEPGIDDAPEGTTVRLSARTGAGVNGLKEVLVSLAGGSSSAETGFLARERHLQALREAQQRLQAASSHSQIELYAEELRLAHRALGAITGEFTADQLLGEIFSRFCIGK